MIIKDGFTKIYTLGLFVVVFVVALCLIIEGLTVIGIVLGFIDIGVTTIETSFALDKLAVNDPL